ncbi:MAG: hypothetical protein AAB965_03725 [Patescibacteria group bacterium]
MINFLKRATTIFFISSVPILPSGVSAFKTQTECSTAIAPIIASAQSLLAQGTALSAPQSLQIAEIVKATTGLLSLCSSLPLQAVVAPAVQVATPSPEIKITAVVASPAPDISIDEIPAPASLITDLPTTFVVTFRNNGTVLLDNLSAVFSADDGKQEFDQIGTIGPGQLATRIYSRTWTEPRVYKTTFTIRRDVGGVATVLAEKTKAVSIAKAPLYGAILQNFESNNLGGAVRNTDMAYVKEGLTSGKIVFTPGANDLDSTTVNIDSKDWAKYRYLEFWIYADSANTGAFLPKLRLDNMKETSGQVYEKTDYAIGLTKGSWQKISIDMQTYARTPASFLQFSYPKIWYGTNTASQIFYIDDIRLSNIEPSSLSVGLEKKRQMASVLSSMEAILLSMKAGLVR